MNSLSFIRSTITALLISVICASGYYLVNVVFPSGSLSDALVVRGCLSVATSLYLIYLLKNADISFGKLTVVALYVVTHIAMFIFWPTLLVYSVVNVGFIWLVRSVYYHSNVAFVLFDFASCLLSMVFAVVALLESHSMFMCLWSFFLTQALVLPVAHYCYSRWFEHANEKAVPSSQVSQRFYEAHHQAEEALRKMA